MDPQTALNWIGGTALAVLGWFARTLYYAVERLKSDHADHKVKVAETYAKKDEIRELGQKIDAGVAGVCGKLDGKADRE